MYKKSCLGKIPSSLACLRLLDVSARCGRHFRDYRALEGLRTSPRLESFPCVLCPLVAQEMTFLGIAVLNELCVGLCIAGGMIHVNIPLVQWESGNITLLSTLEHIVRSLSARVRVQTAPQESDFHAS
jgi:hypothetical protein